MSSPTYLVEGALLIVDDTDWKQVARAMGDYRASQPTARLLIELAGKDRGQPWWWEGVQVLCYRQRESTRADNRFTLRDTTVADSASRTSRALTPGAAGT